MNKIERIKRQILIWKKELKIEQDKESLKQLKRNNMSEETTEEAKVEVASVETIEIPESTPVLEEDNI